jgi:hypothetical protein
MNLGQWHGVIADEHKYTCHQVYVFLKETKKIANDWQRHTSIVDLQQKKILPPGAFL